MAKKKPERKLRLLKMSSGMTVLGATVYDNSLPGREYNVTKPMEVMAIPQRNGQTMLTLMDFVPGVAKDSSAAVQIGKQHVVCTTAPAPEVEELYKQITNPSPIAQPKKDIVLPPGAGE